MNAMSDEDEADYDCGDFLVPPDNATSTKRTQEFPRELDTFSFDDRRYMICGNELGPPTEGNTVPLEVAQKIVGYNEYSIDLNSLTVINLRKLAKKFGLRNFGSTKKFGLRLALAEKKNSTCRYNIDALASSSTSSNDNTKNIVRVINGVFHPDNFEAFLTINDRKTRKDFETGNGAKNDKFWALIADYVNDITNDELEYFRVINDDELYNMYIAEAEGTGYLPTGCSQQTGKTCKAIIDGVVKIRSTIIANMTQSGQNDNDPYQYTGAAIKRHSLVRSVSNFSAYYFFMSCSQHPEIDGVLKRFLDKSVKADSSQSVFDDSVPSSGKKRITTTSSN